MNKIILPFLLLSGLLLASDTKNDLLEKQVKEQMEKEKKYANEQRFYQGSEYDLKSQEVNPDSLDNIDELEVDDLDMDDVYN